MQAEAGFDHAPGAPCEALVRLRSSAAPSLVGADGCALQRLHRSVHASLLLCGSELRVRLAGLPSAVAGAEAALWAVAGEAHADAAGGWHYLDDRGGMRGPVATAQLRAWRLAGYLPPSLAVKNGASTAWLPLRTVLREAEPPHAQPPPPQQQQAQQAQQQQAQQQQAACPMDVDAVEVEATDELALRRHARVDGCSDDELLPDAPAPQPPPPPPPRASLPPGGGGGGDAVRVVIDTCVLLASGALALLSRAAARLAGAAVVVVPWQCARELDGLTRSARPGVARLAREANAELARRFAVRDPFYAGEGAAEGRRSAEAAGPDASPDERLLHAALRLRDGGGGARVVLLSRDANLRLKAGLSGVAALTAEAFDAVTRDGLRAAAAPPAAGAAPAQQHAQQQPTGEPPAGGLGGRGSSPAASAAAPDPRSAAAAAVSLLAQSLPALRALFLVELGPLCDEALKLPAPDGGGDGAGGGGRDVLRLLRRHARLLPRMPRHAAAQAEDAEAALRRLERRGEGGGAAGEAGDARTVACAVAALLGALAALAPGDGALAGARRDADSLARRCGGRGGARSVNSA